MSACTEHHTTLLSIISEAYFFNALSKFLVVPPSTPPPPLGSFVLRSVWQPFPGPRVSLPCAWPLVTPLGPPDTPPTACYHFPGCLWQPLAARHPRRAACQTLASCITMSPLVTLAACHPPGRMPPTSLTSVDINDDVHTLDVAYAK